VSAAAGIGRKNASLKPHIKAHVGGEAKMWRNGKRKASGEREGFIERELLREKEAVSKG